MDKSTRFRPPRASTITRIAEIATIAAAVFAAAQLAISLWW